MNAVNFVRISRFFGAVIVFAVAILLCTSAQMAGKTPAQQQTPSPLKLETTALPDATVGVPYKATIYPDGGKFPYEFSGTGLPDGLAFGYASDTIYGKAATAGSYDVVITVKDGSKPQQTVTLKTKLNVNPAK
jgi:putative Ig domain-containing protein